MRRRCLQRTWNEKASTGSAAMGRAAREQTRSVCDGALGSVGGVTDTIESTAICSGGRWPPMPVSTRCRTRTERQLPTAATLPGWACAEAIKSSACIVCKRPMESSGWHRLKKERPTNWSGV